MENPKNFNLSLLKAIHDSIGLHDDFSEYRSKGSPISGMMRPLRGNLGSISKRSRIFWINFLAARGESNWI